MRAYVRSWCVVVNVICTFSTRNKLKFKIQVSLIIYFSFNVLNLNLVNRVSLNLKPSLRDVQREGIRSGPQIINLNKNIFYYHFTGAKIKQNFINFTATEDVGAGGRHRYLEKEHVLISEYVEDENGNESLKTYWENIYKK